MAVLRILGLLSGHNLKQFVSGDPNRMPGSENLRAPRVAGHSANFIAGVRWLFCLSSQRNLFKDQGNGRNIINPWTSCQIP